LRKLLFSLILGYAAISIVYGQNPSDSARILYIESRQAIIAGNFSLAEDYLERLLKKDYSFSDYQLALVHNRLGYVYFETGQFMESLDQYRLAEGLASRTDPRTLQVRISIHINLGLYYSGLGDYTNALEYNSEAERLLRLVPTWDSISYDKLSKLLLNKGIALYLLGENEEAQGVLNECAQIKRKHNHPYLGSVYFNLARVYENLGDLELSRENYLKGIEQWTSEYDSDYYELANIYLHFGQFLAACDQPEEGLVYLHKSLQNYKKNYGPQHPLTAACYENLARYSLDQGDFNDALDYTQEALQTIEISGHDLTLIKILATKTIAQERLAGGKTSPQEKTKYLQAALATNALSIEVLQRIQNAFLSAESRVFMTSRQKELFTSGIRLNLEMFRLRGDEAYIEEAFLMAAKGKSGELLFEINNKEWLYLESLSDTMAITATELKQLMDHLSNLIQTETMKMNPDSTQMVTWQNQLFQTRDSFNRHMGQLRQDFPQIGHFELNDISFSVNQIRRNLKRNETLVEYFMTGAESAGLENLFIFVISKNDCRFYQSSVDPVFHQNMETIIDKLHGFVPYNENKERFDSLKLALFGMYQDLVQPVESLFSGKNLLIVPDETLSFIPFDALITRLNADSITNYAGIPYLLQDYNISYMYNSQLIKRKRSWDLRFPEVTAWIPEQSTAEGLSLGKLRGAEEEVQEILELVKGRSIQQSLMKPEVVSLLQENSILHLAMHSLANENTGKSPYFILDTLADPMLANRMHDYEINALNLSTPMVVLSSCETAGGRLHSGEGIMSLSRSFLQAGAPSVVHSLWPVEDSNPYYWAAFQITGDTSPLHIKRSGSFITGSILIVFLLVYYLRRRSLFRRV